MLKGNSDVKEMSYSTSKIVGLEIPTETTLHGRCDMTLVDERLSDFNAAAEGSCSANSAIFNYDDY
eukprot:4651294-Ditylum_brightwellii.AAC.1